MNIHVNGKRHTCDSETTLLELLRQLELVPEKVVVEHNGTIVPASLFEQTSLGEDDHLELLQFVGGG